MQSGLGAIIPMDVINSLLKDFGKAFSVSCELFEHDQDWRSLMCRADLCSKFHKKYTKSNCGASRELPSGDHPFTLMQCPLGLVDALFPMMLNDEHKATLIVGQFMTEAPDLEERRQEAERLGFDLEEYLAAVRKIPILSPERLNSLAHFFQGFVGILASLGAEVTMRKTAELELQQAHDELEKRVEERTYELAVSNERMIAAQRISRTGIFERDLLSGKGWWSDEMYRLIGYEPGEIEPELSVIIDHAHPDDYDIFQHLFQVHLRAGKKFNVEGRLVRPDKKTLFLVGEVLPFKDDEGNLTGYKGCIRDMTERRRMEDALRETNRLQALILDNNILGMALVKNRRFYTVNARLSDMFGIPAHEIVGKTTRIMYSNDEAFERLGTEAYRTMEEGKTFELETEFTRKDGTKFWCRFVGRALTPDKADDATVWLFEDVTEKRKTRENLLHQQALYDTMTNAVPDLIYYKDPEGVYLAANEAFAKVVGAPIESIPGKKDRDFFSEEVSASCRRRDNIALQQKHSVQHEAWLVHHDGTESLQEAVKAPVMDIQGNPLGVVSVSRDITNRKIAEKALQESEAKFRAVFEHAGVGMYLANADGVILKVNQHLCDFLEYQSEELLGMHVSELLPEQDMSHELDRQAKLRSGELSEYFEEKRYVTKTGKTVWGDASISSVHSEGQHSYSIRVIADITRRKELETQLRHLANTDALTGADNRLRFMEKADAELKRFHRYKCPFSVLMVDLDKFKGVNDQYGHQAGDDALRLFSEVCQKCIRNIDTLVRMGGEEFAILLPETRAPEAVAFAERLRSTIEKQSLSLPGGESFNFTISIGVAEARQEDTTLDDIVSRADIRLYEAKRLGRNRVIYAK